MNPITLTPKNFEEVWINLKVGDIVDPYYQRPFPSFIRPEGRVILKRININNVEGLICSPDIGFLGEVKHVPNHFMLKEWLEERVEWYATKEDYIAGAVVFKKSYLSLNPIKNMVNITSLLKNITRKEPEKTFIKSGFIDENEEITERGQAALIHLLWDEKKEALKKLADSINEYEKNN